jgi:hypothetical protein
MGRQLFAVGATGSGAPRQHRVGTRQIIELCIPMTGFGRELSGCFWVRNGESGRRMPFTQ